MTLYLHEQEIMRKSREEGRKEGRQEATRFAIKNMLKKFSPEEIVELGYDRELVMSIVKEN